MKNLSKIALFALVALFFTNCSSDTPAPTSIDVVGTWLLTNVKGKTKTFLDAQPQNVDEAGNGMEITFKSDGTYSTTKPIVIGSTTIPQSTNLTYSKNGSDLKLQINATAPNATKAFIYVKVGGAASNITLQFTLADYIRGLKESPGVSATDVATFEVFLPVLDITSTFKKK
jgi:hypothetical protein